MKSAHETMLKEDQRMRERRQQDMQERIASKQAA